MMTNEEYQALDNQVHRVVFGERVVDCKDISHYRASGRNPSRYNSHIYAPEYHVCPESPSPGYSQDMSAAWKVVEKLRSLGFDILVSTEDSEWEVEINTTAPLYEQGHHGVIIADSDPARAICRAAIRVMTKR